MPELLAEDVQVREQDDLRLLLGKDWYASIDVVNTQDAEQRSFENCSQYLAGATPGTRTLRENEMGPFLELAAMCRATKALVAAQSAEISYLPEEIFGHSTPHQLPAAMALVTSASEAEKHAADRTAEHWSDVNDGFTMSRISGDAAEYSHSAGKQLLEVVGRGDFDGDKVEDVLVSSRDSVDGGSYFNLRLFALTVNAEGEWRIIKD